MEPLFRVYAVVADIPGVGEGVLHIFATEGAAEGYRTEVERQHRRHRNCGLHALKIAEHDVIGTTAEGLAIDERARLER